VKLEYLAVMNLHNLNRIILVALCSILSFNSYGQSSSRLNCNHNHSAKNLSNSNSRCDTVDIIDTYVYLDFTNFSSNNLRGYADIVVSPLMVNIPQLHFDLEGLITDSVFVNSTQLFFNHFGPDLFIYLPNLPSWTNFTVRIYYHGTPIHDTSWGGFYYSSGYAYNMGVGMNALPHNYGRVWFPCFDNFRERCTYTIQTLTDGGRTSYCGGLRSSVENLGGDSLLTTWNLLQPVPSYLASVAVTNYTHVEDEFTSLGGFTRPIWLAARASDTLDMKNSFVHLHEALLAFETKYGNYAFDKVGFTAVPFSGGAMEHATNVAYPLFAIDGTTTYETLYAHELSHHWWGDLVTCETAADMWINEGMASYSERIFTEWLYGSDAYSNSIRNNHRDVLLNAARNDGGHFPLNAIPENVTYGETVYNKGADVAHSLRGFMGDENFFQAIHDLISEYQFSTLNSAQMRDFFQAYTTEDLSEFFNGWVFQPGYPDFRLIGYSYSTQFVGFELNVHVDQYLHHNTNYLNNVPLEVTVMDFQGNTDTVLIHASGESSTATATVLFEPAHVMLNRADKLHYATLADEAWNSTTGSHDLTYANFEYDVNDLGNMDSIFVRSEMHLTAADRVTALPMTDYVISPDRYWHVNTYANETTSTKMTLRFNGSATATSALDTSLFQLVQQYGMNESNMVLLYRWNAFEPWTEIPNATLFTSGSSTNWNGRFELLNPRSGDYAFGFHSGIISVDEIENPSLPFNINNNEITSTNFRGKYNLTNVNGQQLLKGKSSDGFRLNISEYASGIYFLQLNSVTYKVFLK
jgi:aminopeptidase N